MLSQESIRKRSREVKSGAGLYKYKYNGQEYQDELGLNLYDMDFRDYDPAIARWTGIDPVLHYSQSTYNAFDGNPVFWADPSGADSETDYLGRNKFDNFGIYIPPTDRADSQINPIDTSAAIALMGKAKLYFDNEIVSELTESEKQEIFKTDALKTIGILLWEFATGTGMEKRNFNYGEHPFATQYIDGKLGEIFRRFNDKLNESGFKVRPKNTDYYTLSLPFSPTSNPASWGESIARHVSASKIEFFIGGAIVKIRMQNDNVEGQVINLTSRESLLLHVAGNYNRSDGNRPLSTIYQLINFSFPQN
ncbi:MAG: hypothetical protein PHC34_13225 [Candidatus Gastranaerophilales bacterium]|nr:hypothetical protein [Candidatus Gastranaerophilales bacterium]